MTSPSGSDVAGTLTVDAAGQLSFPSGGDITSGGSLKVVGSLYRKLGLSAPDADARAVLFYTFLFGQSMLFLDETPRRRANLVAASARFLLEIEQK